MSHIPQVENKPINFEFSKKIKYDKIVEKKILDISEGPSSVYQDLLRFIYMAEFNCKGLLENIKYIFMLIKKQKINLSFDIYLEEIYPIVMKNYKIKIINEFSLMKLYSDTKRGWGNDKLGYTNEYIHYSEGLSFMKKIYEKIESCKNILNSLYFNTHNKRVYTGDGFYDIIDKNPHFENNINNAKNHKTQVSIETTKKIFTGGFIDKICDSTLKYKYNKDSDRHKQIKKKDIIEVVIILEQQEIEYMSVPTWRFCRFPGACKEYLEFEKWVNEKNSYLNIETFNCY